MDFITFTLSNGQQIAVDIDNIALMSEYSYVHQEALKNGSAIHLKEPIALPDDRSINVFYVADSIKEINNSIYLAKL